MEKKGTSKAIYIIAKICKIFSTILIPLILLVMVVTPYIINGIEVDNNKVAFNNNEENVVLVENEDPKTMDAIQKFLDNNNKGTIVIYAEVILILVIVCLYLSRVFYKNMEQLFNNIHNEESPFSLDNVNHLRNMGNYMIGLIIVPVIITLLISAFVNTEVTVSLDLSSIIIVLAIFALSHVFEYGYNKEQPKKTKKAKQE